MCRLGNTHRDIFCKVATSALDAMALGPNFELRVSRCAT